MPYDGDPKKYETKPAAFSIERLVAWLEQRDPKTVYEGGSVFDCLFCRWLSAETGERVVYAGSLADPGKYRPADGGRLYDLHELEYTIARKEPHIYGAALDRAKALLSSQSR